MCHNNTVRCVPADLVFDRQENMCLDFACNGRVALIPCWQYGARPLLRASHAPKEKQESLENFQDQITPFINLCFEM